MTKPREIEIEGGVYILGEGAFVHPDAIVGAGTKIWDGARVMGGSVVGMCCVIGAGVGIEGAQLGDYCKVQNGNTLYHGVSADDYAFFGPNATTTNDHNPRAFGDWQLSRIHLGVGASIGANATLVAQPDTLEIGALSVVGSGSVVTKSVPEAAVVVGNPARHIGWANVEGMMISRDTTSLPPELEDMLNDPRLAIEKLLAKQAMEIMNNE
ncbi:MAG: N-acetyltransferase [Candidatus Saccharimonas sp.]